MLIIEHMPLICKLFFNFNFFKKFIIILFFLLPCLLYIKIIADLKNVCN